MSSAEIARWLGEVTACTITNRIDVLTKQRIINIRSIVNPEALGDCVLADVFIETEPGLLHEFAKKVGEMPQVSYVACATGDTDIIISVRAHDIQEMYDFVTVKVGKTHGVRHTRIYLLPLNIKDNVTWMPPDVLDYEENNSSPDPQHHTQGV